MQLALFDIYRDLLLDNAIATGFCLWRVGVSSAVVDRFSYEGAGLYIFIH